MSIKNETKSELQHIEQVLGEKMSNQDVDLMTASLKFKRAMEEATRTGVKEFTIEYTAAELAAMQAGSLDSPIVVEVSSDSAAGPSKVFFGAFPQKGE